MDLKLKKQLESSDQKPGLSKPIIFDLQNHKDEQAVLKLFTAKKILCITDDYEEQLKELFAINNPILVYAPNFTKNFKDYLVILKKQTSLSSQGKWVYFPWNGNFVHILKDSDFQKVRTARNRYLIDDKEQAKFYNSVIGIGGLSVGNSVALAIVLQGGGKHIKLADFDSLALTNLNRVRAGVTSLGLNKTEVTARQIYELNPYAKLELFPVGLNEKNLKKFFAGPPKLDIVIDELDNIAIKYLIRTYAKKYRVPLVMGADNGDNAVIDIERYDQNNKTKFFHGRIGNTTFEELKKLDKFGIGKTITKHIGPENLSKKVQDSLLAMGKTIVSWPQLGGAALLNGSAIAYCVRKILNGQPLENNRALISLDEKLTPDYNTAFAKKSRAKVAKKFKKIFHLN